MTISENRVGLQWPVLDALDRPDRIMIHRGMSAVSKTVLDLYEENQISKSKISLTKLLGFYFMVIDPLSVNRQGNDRGIQYRTGIYYTEDEQIPEIESVFREQEKKAGAKQHSEAARGMKYV